MALYLPLKKVGVAQLDTCLPGGTAGREQQTKEFVWKKLWTNFDKVETYQNRLRNMPYFDELKFLVRDLFLESCTNLKK